MKKIKTCNNNTLGLLENCSVNFRTGPVTHSGIPQ